MLITTTKKYLEFAKKCEEVIECLHLPFSGLENKPTTSEDFAKESRNIGVACSKVADQLPAMIEWLKKLDDPVVNPVCPFLNLYVETCSEVSKKNPLANRQHLYSEVWDFYICRKCELKETEVFVLRRLLGISF